MYRNLVFDFQKLLILHDASALMIQTVLCFIRSLTATLYVKNVLKGFFPQTRTLAEDSHAGIKLSSPEQAVPAYQDRIVTVTGTFAEQLHAVALITKKMLEDANYAQYASGSSYTGNLEIKFFGIHCVHESSLALCELLSRFLS